MSYTSPQDAGQPRTLYVGNLDSRVTEDLMYTLFQTMGPLSGCKILQETGYDPYCFVEFVNHNDAATALTTMNQRKCLGRELRVNWASSSNHQQQNARPDTSKHFHIFVGDLSPQIDTAELRTAFAVFGEISDCRVVKDLTTNKSRGYGFVSFSNKANAENAIQHMNGTWLGSRAIRTNWATRKPLQKEEGGHNSGHGYHRLLNYDDVFKQSSSTNCTVYCGGLNAVASTEGCLREAFEEFGDITDVRVFKEKGYAFIKFNSKEAACKAIVARHNTDIGGQSVKCSWGKEQEHQPQHSYPSYSEQAYPMNYWYPGYPVDNGYVGENYMNPMYSAAQYGQYYGQYSLGGGAGGNGGGGVPLPQGSPSGQSSYPSAASAAAPQQYSSH